MQFGSLSPRRSPSRFTERKTKLWETVCVCVSVYVRVCVCSRLTGQVSMSTAGFPTLLDTPLRSPWAQRFTGAAYSMDLSAHLCLETHVTHVLDCSLNIAVTLENRHGCALCVLTCLSLRSFIICPIWNSTKFMKMDLVKCSRAYAAARYGIRRHCWHNRYNI